MIVKCNLCAHNCNVDRDKNLGVCMCKNSLKVALSSIHMWEEPCISKINGSGTVFFSGCNLKCVFCQNYTISHENYGKEISVERLSDIFIELQNKNVNNINLVSPTPYVKEIIEAIKIAKEKGLIIPIIYNTGGYENVETIKMLNGYIDVYLPDLKYFSDDVSILYSKAPNYFNVATNAIKEMIAQVGEAKFDENGIIKKGVIIRHLVLPSYINETKHILSWIKENLPKDVYISIMLQYFPTYKVSNFPLINRKVSKKEFEIVKKLIKDFENGYIQDLGKHEEEYVPNFDLSRSLKVIYSSKRKMNFSKS